MQPLEALCRRVAARQPCRDVDMLHGKSPFVPRLRNEPSNGTIIRRAEGEFSWGHSLNWEPPVKKLVVRP